ncbi:SGNH/GDSL hydrolase family protein [Gordonia hydrophobica]|uniref:SGNH/GDSL hydrolase family protein n=1 Tax=Gordonia hydrophobica TaxID=40516 RepID=A0ABZ2U636_9ACTN|nr:SGNH/GDSL hydrolase family protein [Gordonia hydrophobica]MBM7368656.1 lysophospholipase L1-like esterase [Gordonia hydrophobica]
MIATPADGALRYVAIGDSLSEGVGDAPWSDGVPRGWTDRLAGLLAAQYPETVVQYGNLAIRGQKARQVLQTQLAAAREVAPHVVTLTAGMNDILRPRVDFDRLRTDLTALVDPFTEAGTAVVVVPIPDVSGVSPAGRLVDGRRRALNAIYSELVDDHRVLPLTPTAGTVFEDPRAWADDRLHLGPLGHQRLAEAAAATLGLPVSADHLAAPDGPPPPRTAAGELRWVYRHVAPWLGRRLRGASSGDGRTAKRPELLPVRR